MDRNEPRNGVPSGRDPDNRAGGSGQTGRRMFVEHASDVNQRVEKVCRACGGVCQVDHARAICPYCDQSALASDVTHDPECPDCLKDLVDCRCIPGE